MSIPNLMDSIESPNGSVAVKLQLNTFSKSSADKYCGRTMRNTHTVGNVLQLVKNKVPQYDMGTVYSVCEALENVIAESLASGSAVKCLHLGTFYLACKGTTDGTLSTDITVGFTPSESIKKSVENISVRQENYITPIATISEIQDVDTAETSGVLTLNGSVKITGKKLKIAGSESGIWFALATGTDKTISSDCSDWIAVTSSLAVNMPGTLLFALPKTLEKGFYRIVLRTRCPSSVYRERKDLMETVSGVVETK